MGDDPAAGIEFAAEGAAPEPRWHVAMGEEVYGPATKSELIQWAAEGRLLPGAQAVPVGGERWVPLHTAPGLEDVPLAPPPCPGPAAYAYGAAPRPVGPRPLCACPHCAGPVTNVAPAYGWPWGLFQRSLRPQFRCGQCGRAIEYEELSRDAQAQVSRGVRNGSFAWFGIVIGLILFVALCLFSAFSAFR